MSTPRFVQDLAHAALADMDGSVVVIRIFVDESGTHDGSPVVTVGAYAGRSEVWKKFTKAWNRAKKPIEVFHATDCAALRGEFEGWTETDRNELVANLLPVLPKFELYGIAMGINLRDYDEALARHPNLKPMLRSPYGVSFQWAVQNIIERTERNGLLTEPIAIFHEQNDFQEDALKGFEWVKAMRKRHVGSMTLTFAEKSKFVPLQAADVLAYEANKRLRDPRKPQRRSIAAMDPTGERITVEGFAKHNMDALVAKLKLMADEIEVFGHPNRFLRRTS